MLFDHSDSKLFLAMVILQFPSSCHNMPKKGGNKKDKDHEEGSYVEVLPKMEFIYEDTKAIIRANPDFKSGQIYYTIKDRNVPDAGLEDIPLYVNIRKSSITKVSTHPEIFPCAEVIGWILP